MEINAALELQGYMRSSGFQSWKVGIRRTEEGYASICGFKPSASSVVLERYVSFKNQGGTPSSIYINRDGIVSAEGLATTGTVMILSMTNYGFTLHVTLSSSAKDLVTYWCNYIAM